MENRPEKRVLISCRLKPRYRNILAVIANRQNRTISSLIDQAIAEFIDRELQNNGEENQQSLTISSAYKISSNDLTKIEPAIRALGPVPLSLFLEMITAARSNSTPQEPTST